MAIYYDGYDWDIDGFPGAYVYGDYEYVDDYYMDERWKRIWDAPDYWVSTKARVWSSMSRSFIEGTPLKNGHIDMSLRLNGRRIHRYLHRLVAEAFIPNPCGGYFFITPEDFDESFDYTNYPYQRRGLSIKAIKLNTGETRIYDKPRYAAIDLGMSEASVSNVLRGKARSAKGWIFEELNIEEDVDEHFY